MPSVTRVHGSNTQVGTLYSPNCNCYNIYVSNNEDGAVDLTAEDSYGGNAQVDGIIETIVKELNPLAWFTPANTSGVITIILDTSADEARIDPSSMAQELTTRLRRLPSDYTNTTQVWPATSIAFGDNS